MLPTELLSEYIQTFYGYGSWANSKFWFVGIEEGGGNEMDRVNRRLLSWESLGKTDLIDCREHHIKMGSIIRDSPEKRHSPTWTRLILVKLVFESRNTATADILNLQLNDWGNLDSTNLLIELFPLPSPGVKNWFYPDWVNLNSDISFLKDRSTYKASVINNRISNIREKIAQYKPEVVLFYGKSMCDHWDEIIGTSELESVPVLNHAVRYLKKAGTLYVQCPQPSYIRGYAFWRELGNKIKSLSASN